MPQSKKSSTSRLDAMARQQGFPNYAAMKAWNEKYRKPVQATAPKPKTRNFLETITDVVPILYSSRRASAAMQSTQKKKKKP